MAIVPNAEQELLVHFFIMEFSMTKFFTTITMIFIIIGIIIWSLIFVLGGAEILWWIFTGDFFHFVSTSVEVANAVW